MSQSGELRSFATRRWTASGSRLARRALLALALLQTCLCGEAVLTSRLPLANEDTGVTKCTYTTPSSPQTPEYYERAWGVEASREPWKWPITAKATSPVSVVSQSQYAGIVNSIPLFRKDACNLPSHVLNISIDTVVGPSGMIAVGYMSNRHHSLRYGHIWDYLNSFYCAFVRTRAETQWTRPLRIFVPAGMVRCSKEHEASLALFGSKRAQQVFGFTMERAPWVPSCILLAKSCYVHGGVPEELRGQVTLFNDFRLGPFKLFLKQHVQFRDRVHDALGLGTGPPMSILYVRSSQWPTGRRVGEEEKVVAQLALWAAREHPTLSFRAEHVHWLSYVEEVAAFADARVLISLWGSSLHNCRYMRAGSLVVELHGALDSKFGDTTIYTQACSGSCGLLLAPYGVPGAFPRDARRGTEHWGHPLTNVRIKYDAKVARVDPQILVNLLKKIFPADPCALPDWLSVFVAYNAFLARQLHPRTQKPLTTLSREYTDKRWLPAQYRTPPWCNRTAAVRSITNASGSLRPVDNQGLMLRSDRATV